MKNYTAVQHTKKKNNKKLNKNPNVRGEKKLGNGEKKVFIPLTGSLAIMNIPNHDIVGNGRSPPYKRAHRLPGSGCKCQHFVECVAEAPPSRVAGSKVALGAL